MKQIITILTVSILVLSCSGDKKDKTAELSKLKSDRASLDAKIKTLEAETSKNNPRKATSVTISIAEYTNFTSNIEVQSQVVGDENVLATPQAPGVITSVKVQSGQKVSKGQVLATMDAAAIDQQVKAADVQLTLLKSLYEKQKALFAQNIGSEVQLLQAKAQYDANSKQKDALIAQRNMYRIISPISGTVDNVSLKIGDMASPGQNGIRVVSFDKMKAEASLGENYLGKVKAGDKVTLIFPDLNDSISAKLTYVARQVDPISRAFMVQIRIANSAKIYPNMSCVMKISNYENANALVVPVQVIQKTAAGQMLYIMEGNKAKSVIVTTGKNSNGIIEVLSGLKAGDKVITEGFSDIDDGEIVAVK